MIFNHRSRQQKLVEALYPFFGDIVANNQGSDLAGLRVCRHLQALKERAIDDPAIKPFLILWDRDHPEENPLTNDELIWALESLDDHISSTLRELDRQLIIQMSPRAKLSVINGGLSKNPAIPYVPLSEATYDDY